MGIWAEKLIMGRNRGIDGTFGGGTDELMEWRNAGIDGTFGGRVDELMGLGADELMRLLVEERRIDGVWGRRN